MFVITVFDCNSVSFHFDFIEMIDQSQELNLDTPTSALWRHFLDEFIFWLKNSL